MSNKKTKTVLSIILLSTFLLLGGCNLKKQEINLNIPSYDDQVKFNTSVADYKKNQTNSEHINGGLSSFLIPANYNLELGIEKGIGNEDGFTNAFFEIQSLYRSILENYLLQEFSLSDFDKKIQNILVDTTSSPEYKMDFYQKYSSFSLDYIYLRNNIYIERLSLEDINLFKEYFNEDTTKNISIDQLTEIVLKTYPTILMFYPNQSADMKILLENGPTDVATTINNQDIIFYISVSPTTLEDGHSVNQENYNNTVSQIKQLIDSESETVSSNSSIELPVRFSVK